MYTGVDKLPASIEGATVDVVFREVRRCGERSEGDVALQLAGGQQQLPRTENRLLSIYQVSLHQEAAAGPHYRGQIFQGDQASEPW